MDSATTAGAPASDLDEMAVLCVDARGTVIAAEAACAHYFGGSRKDLLGRNVRDAAGDRLDPFVRRAMGGHASHLDLELRGREARFHFVPRPEQGGALIIAHDHASEARPPDASTYLRTFVEQAPGGVWATDKDLRITFIMESVFDGEPVTAGQTLQASVGTSDPTNVNIAHHLAALAGHESNYRVRTHGRLLQKKVRPLRSVSGEIIGTIGACVDVTEWAATEEELAKARCSLESAQRIAHVGSFEWDPERGILSCSDEMCRIYAIPRTAPANAAATVVDRIHPDDVTMVRAMLLQAYRTTESIYFDHRIVRADGEIRSLHCRVGALRGQGTAISVAGTCWDQTELKRTQDELEHNVSLLEGIVDATADGILVVNRAGKVTTYNRQFISLWRIPPELVASRLDDELLHQVVDSVEDSGAFIQRVRKLYEAPEEESFDVIHLKDGRVFERKSIPQRIRNEVVGRVWSFRDVTGREQRLRSALFLNDATRLLSSLEEERALQGIARLSVPYLGQVCTIDLIRGESPHRFTAVVSERDCAPTLHPQVLEGHQLEYKVGAIAHLAAPLTRDRTVLGAITFVAQPSRSFSEWEAATVAELARRISYAISDHLAQREAREALNARDDFLGIVAHELRGPLASIHLSAQRLAKGGLTTTAQTTLLATIAREDRRLERLLEEIVDLERARTGQLHISLERVDLSEVTAAVVARLEPQIQKSGSSVTTKSNGPAAGEWDRLNLERVVDNLLRNALKFGLGRPITITVDGSSDGAATIVVEDHGTGIPVAMREKIFRPFERAVSSRYYGGLGLGLFVANAIVGALGGNIQVDSEEGNGSRFTVVLPRKGGD